LRDKYAKGIKLHLPIHGINDNLIAQIYAIIEENRVSTEQQKCTLNFIIHDTEKSINLELPSKSLKVNPNNDFLDQLTALNTVNYEICK
jgi:DNA polymerase-3 subunit alpha